MNAHPVSSFRFHHHQWAVDFPAFLTVVTTHKAQDHANFLPLAAEFWQPDQHAVLSFTYIKAKILNILIPYHSPLTPFSRRQKEVPGEKRKLERHRGQAVNDFTSHSLKMGPYPCTMELSAGWREALGRHYHMKRTALPITWKAFSHISGI